MPANTPQRPIRIMERLASLKPLLVVVLLVSLILFLNYRGAQRRRARFYRPPTPVSTNIALESFEENTLFAPNTPGTASQLQPYPRFFGNLATQVGDYWVSVRQVVGTTSDQNLYINRPRSFPDTPPRQVILSLQVLAATPQAAQALEGFSQGFKATDSTGLSVPFTRTGEPIAIPNGFAQAAYFTAPAFRAQFLQVQSALRIREGKDANKVLPFRLKDIPLPVGFRVYGEASANFLATTTIAHKEVAKHGKGVRELAPKASATLAPHFPPNTPEPNSLRLPWRILLQAGRANHIPILLPLSEGKTARVWCNINVNPFADGELYGNIAFSREGVSAAPITLPFRFWERNSGVYLLPDSLKAMGDPPGTLAVRLHLYMEFLPRRLVEVQVPPPFAATNAETACNFTGQAFVLEERMGRGVGRISITREGETPQTESIPIRLDAGGYWKMTGMAQGKYTFRVLSLEPYRTYVMAKGPVDDYFRRRYNMPNYGIENEQQFGVMGEGGKTTALRPWRVYGTKAQGFRPPRSL